MKKLFAKLAQASREDAKNEALKQAKYDALHTLTSVLANKKATKAQLIAAIEEACGYLSEVREDE